MKTYNHSIEGKEYTLRITGTVGIIILAEKIVTEDERYMTATDDEGKEISIPTPKWLMALLYSAFIASNKDVDVDFITFMTSFSSKEFNEAKEWYYTEFAEREGFIQKDEDEKHDDETPDEQKKS